MPHNKTQIFHSRFLIVLLLLCFVGMTGYSDLLHDHNHDFSESHDDCSPCNWSKSHKVNTTKTNNIVNVSSFTETTSQLSLIKSENVLPVFYNRGPPFNS